jgi:hypothetical protein
VVSRPPASAAIWITEEVPSFWYVKGVRPRVLQP